MINRRVSGACLVLFGSLIAVLGGCSGGGSSPPPNEAVAAAGQSLEANGVEVEIYTATERLVVTGFRFDFPERRNVTSLVGFPPDDYDHPVTVPLANVREIVFRGVIDQPTFDRIYKDRQQIKVNQQEVFNLQVSKVDGTRADLIAVIPRIRGLQNGSVWELPMAGNADKIDRIVVRH